MKATCNNKLCPCFNKIVNPKEHCCNQKILSDELSKYEHFDVQELYNSYQIRAINRKALQKREKRVLRYLQRHIMQHEGLTHLNIKCQFHYCNDNAEYVHSDWDSGKKSNTIVCRNHMPESKGLMTVEKIVKPVMK